MTTELSRAKHKSNEDTIRPTQGGNYLEHKADDEAISRHINSYHPSITYYTHEKVPNRRYLKPELSIKEKYNNCIGNSIDTGILNQQLWTSARFASALRNTTQIYLFTTPGNASFVLSTKSPFLQMLFALVHTCGRF